MSLQQPRTERRLGAIMFTDVVGFTSMSSRNEVEALGLLGKYRQVFLSVFPKYGGRVVKTLGDGFLVEFASAVDAVDCAVEAQKGMAELNSTLGERKILARIGIHVGDIVVSGEDVLGDAVNVASRVQTVAEPGGICLTRQALDQVRGKVQWAIRAMGWKELKNLPEPVEVFSVGTEAGAEELELGQEAPLDRHRLAILPFANLSPDPNDRYFADGMTEELTSTLSKIGGLSVISRSSAMTYRDKSLPAAQIGRELGVGSILEGSIRKAGNKVRISVQLIDVTTDNYVWSDSFDRDLTDIFEVQGDIARRVAEELKVQMLVRDEEKLDAKATDVPEAYTFYLKGRYYWNERTEDSVRRGTKFFGEAIKLDQEFALAYAGLADCYAVLSDYGWMEPGSAGAQAEKYAMRALELDSSLAEAHASLGLIRVNHHWDFGSAELEFKRAIELNPNYVSAYQWYSVMLTFSKRYDEALKVIEKAMRLDPLSPVLKQSKGVALIADGRYDEAVEVLRKVAKERPELPSVHYWMALASLGRSDFPTALEEVRKEVEADNFDSGSKLDMAYVQSEAGNKKDAEKTLEAVLADKGSYYSPSKLGMVLISLGREKEGLEWLLTGLKERDPALLYLRCLSPYQKNLESQGWKEIERKMGIV